MEKAKIIVAYYRQYFFLRKKIVLEFVQPVRLWSDVVPLLCAVSKMLGKRLFVKDHNIMIDGDYFTDLLNEEKYRCIKKPDWSVVKEIRTNTGT